MDFRNEMTKDEKLARQMSGVDSEAVFSVGSEKAYSEQVRREKVEKFNQEVGDLQEKFEKHAQAIQEAVGHISADMNNVEIMPLTSYALIQPFKTNPFQRIQMTKSGIVTDLGGMTPTYKSQESGQVEEETPYVKTGTVIETGPDCRFLQTGDIVIYNVGSEIMVPFFRFGFVAVSEQRIIAVVNEGLTERKKEIIRQKKIQ